MVRNQAFRVALPTATQKSFLKALLRYRRRTENVSSIRKLAQPGIFSRSLEGDPSRNPEERLVDDFLVPVGGMLPVPNGIYYTGVTPQGKQRAFRFFDYATHRAKDIAPAPSSITVGLTVSPDQHQLLYPAINDGSGDDLLLLEFR